MLLLFLFSCHLLSFPTCTSCGTSNSSVSMDILLLFPVLEENILACHRWVWCLLWTCHKWPLLCWGKFPLYLFCYEFLIINECWIFSNTFPFFEMIIWFLSFILLQLCITLIDLWISNNSCMPEINPTWSWCMTLLIYCLIQFYNIYY